MDNVGLGYLSLGRSAKTLSGGESQRIRLAAQLGSNLRGVLYVLDEPTIGLHPRDNFRLLETLTALREKGNSLVIVEHDEATMRRADHIIDLGPRAGIHGGEVVASGTLREIERAKDSETGRCLKAPLCHPIRKSRRSLRDVARLDRDQACAGEQSEERRGKISCRSPVGHHRNFRQRQIHLDGRCPFAGGTRAIKPKTAPRRGAVRASRRHGSDRCGLRSRPIAHRENLALDPGDLHQGLR